VPPPPPNVDFSALEEAGGPIGKLGTELKDDGSGAPLEPKLSKRAST